MKKWKCTVCGYIHEGDNPPEKCPVCSSDKEKFVLLDESTTPKHDAQEIMHDTADVLVVGSGAAAFSAAVSARENGASVIMFEKGAVVGGTTKRSGGGMWVPMNKWQMERGDVDNTKDAIRYMARYSYPHLYNAAAEHYGIPAHEFSLLEAYVENARKMIAKYDENGALHTTRDITWVGKEPVDYQDTLPENKEIRGRTIYPRNEEGKTEASGAELIRQMHAWAKDHEIEIIVNAAVTEILQNENGRVIGLQVKVNGKVQTFHANKGVIFGSGGYSHNPEYMLQFQRGPHYGGCAVPTNTGDFIRMGGAIGTRIGNTAGAFRAQSMIEAYLRNPGASSNVFYLPGDSMLLVNKYGKRIVDEKRNYTDRTMVHFEWDPLHAEWTNMLTFMLFDERCASLWQGWPPFPAGGQKMPYLIKADTLENLQTKITEHLEQLAVHTGSFSLAPEFLNNLKETITRFNGFASAGIDEDFHRGEDSYDREWTTFPPTLPGAKWPPKGSKNYTMFPLDDKGPYYAIILAAGTLDTNGGPVVNEHAQVLNWNDEVIPGLYGAGNCIASPTANAYWGAGSTIGPALTFGYIAGNDIMNSK